MKRIHLVLFAMMYNLPLFSQDCEATIKALLPDGVYEYRNLEFSEERFKSVILWYKYHKDDTFDESKSASASATIPLEGILVGFGLSYDETGYKRFIENIEYYYNNFQSYKASIKTNWKTINVDAIEKLEDCFKHRTGLTLVPVLTDDPKIRIVRLFYNADYRNSPTLANLSIVSKTPNISLKGTNLRNIQIGDKASIDFIITKTDNKTGAVTFRSTARAAAGKPLTVTMPATPKVVIPSTKTDTIRSTQLTCVPPHIGGDADFDGNVSTNSECELVLNPDSTELILKLTMTAQEIDGDTRAAGSESVSLYKSARKILQIKSAMIETSHFNFTNDPRGEYLFVPFDTYANRCIKVGCDFNIGPVSLKLTQQMSDNLKNSFMQGFSNRGLVKAWKFIADQDGDEAGTLTRVTVITHPIQIVVAQ